MYVVQPHLMVCALGLVKESIHRAMQECIDMISAIALKANEIRFDLLFLELFEEQITHFLFHAGIFFVHLVVVELVGDHVVNALAIVVREASETLAHTSLSWHDLLL